MKNFYLDNPDLKFHLTHPLMRKIVELKERGFADKDQFDYAPVDFEDAMSNYDRILEIIGGICGETLAENAESVDLEGPEIVDNEVVYAKGTRENLKAIVDAGLMGITLPRKYNGLNFPMVPYIMAADMVSRADAGFVNIWGLQDCAETIYTFASEEQKMKYLPRIANGATAAMALTEPDAGSDLQAVQLKAIYDENSRQWYLNGVKRFITNGDGDISLVLARSEEGTSDGRGLSLFIYDRAGKAVTIRRIENKLGIKGSPTCEIVFKNAPAELVGCRRLGLIKYVMALMNSARLGIVAQSVGIGEAAYRTALDYARNRKQFGKQIIAIPAVFEMLSMMKAKIDASRSLLYETSRFVDIYKAYSHIANERKLLPEEQKEMKHYQKLADMYTPLAKATAGEMCNQAAYDALQIHGGSGYMADYPVQRIYRDARITTIYEGTTQLQVVAAIRGVTTGLYLEQIRVYENTDLNPELHKYRNLLKEMTSEYENAVKQVVAAKNTEYLDFHARRLIEMAGNIIMGYLMILDSERDRKYLPSADIFIKTGRSENYSKSAFIANFDIEDIEKYKCR